MSGHSKWSTIKHKKEAHDQKRGKIFTQLAKNITVAVRHSGIGDPNENPSLRLAMDKAREGNMPHDNITRAIDRGLGKSASGVALEEITYEGYGPAGAGFMVIARTDNKQRTSAEVRHAFEKAGGSLGGPGSAGYLFSRTGGGYTVTIPLEIASPEDQKNLQDLIDTLEELDDVEQVFTNATWPGKEQSS